MSADGRGAIRAGAELAFKMLQERERPEDSRETLDKLQQALALAEESDGVDRTAQLSHLGEGWLGEEALAIAVYAALVGESFPDVIALAANHDGDSDSTASIAAQIYGAAHGVAGLPAAWCRRLDVLEPLLILAHDLHALSVGEERMLREYPPH